MGRYHRVACIGGDHAGAIGGILHGLYHFARPDKQWIMRDFSRQRDDLFQIERAIEFRPDAIVAHVGSQEVADRLRATRRPVVTWSFMRHDFGFPRVGVDERQVGCMGADYFLSRGYRHFGFALHEEWAFSQERLAGFRERVGAAGCEVHIMPRGEGLTAPAKREPRLEFRARWLRDLPKPAAVMTDIDSEARLLCESATTGNLRVPEDVAVLGVSNYELLCDLYWPPLSSIRTPDERIGYELGHLVELALAGRPLPEVTLLQPLEVVERRSTQDYATNHSHLTMALRLMRERVADGIDVTDLLDEVPISRGHLFRLFKAHLGRSPLEEIHRLRCEAAKQLLISTDLPMPIIATKTGFCSSSHLARAFKKITGITPGAFRRRK